MLDASRGLKGSELLLSNEQRPQIHFAERNVELEPAGARDVKALIHRNGLEISRWSAILGRGMSPRTIDPPRKVGSFRGACQGLVVDGTKASYGVSMLSEPNDHSAKRCAGWATASNALADGRLRHMPKLCI